MKHRYVTVPIVSVVLVLVGVASQGEQSVLPKVSTVMAQQRHYFSTIRSVEFSSNETINFSEEACAASGGKTPKVLHNDMRFASAGPLYRSEVDAYEEDPGQATTFISLYNAVDRKKLVRFPGKNMLQATAPEGDDYCGANVLVGVFDFALRRGDTHSLKPLQANAKWDDLGASVMSVRDESLMGHDGVSLTMRHLPMYGGTEQVTTAVSHAGFAAAATTFGGAQQHLGHALNCIEGKGGKNFNASWGHPCEGQGNGILNDLRGVAVSGALMPLVQSAGALATSGVKSNDLTAARLAARGVEALLRLVAENLK